MPLFFRLLERVSAVEVVANRIAWSVPLLLAIVWATGRWPQLRAALTDRRSLLAMAASSLFIAANWLIYVWAVNDRHVLAASLGYFINPLVGVVLGYLIFRERLTRAQWLAVAVAAAGVAVLAVDAWRTLWISLALAFSWAGYGVVRKTSDVGPVVGLTMECGILLAPSLAWIAWAGANGGHRFGSEFGLDALLVASAAVTALPLMLYAAAVKKMRFATIGLLQYLAPTMQFAIGAFVFGEPLSAAQLACFALIWAALALYSRDALRRPEQGDDVPVQAEAARPARRPA